MIMNIRAYESREVLERKPRKFKPPQIQNPGTETTLKGVSPPARLSFQPRG